MCWMRCFDSIWFKFGLKLCYLLGILSVLLSFGGGLQMLMFRVYGDPVNYVEPIILLFIGVCAVITAKIRKKKYYLTLLVLCCIGFVCGLGVIIYYIFVRRIRVYRGNVSADGAEEIMEKFDVDEKQYEELDLKRLSEDDDNDFFLTSSEVRIGLLIKSCLFLVMEVLVVVVFRHQYLEDMDNLMPRFEMHSFN